MFNKTLKYIGGAMLPFLFYGCTTVTYQPRERWSKNIKTATDLPSEKKEFEEYVINDNLIFNKKKSTLELTVSKLRYEENYKVQNIKTADLYEVWNEKTTITNYRPGGMALSILGGTFLTFGGVSVFSGLIEILIYHSIEDSVDKEKLGGVAVGSIWGGLGIALLGLISYVPGKVFVDRGKTRESKKVDTNYKERNPKVSTERIFLEKKLIETVPAINTPLELYSYDILINEKGNLEARTDNLGKLTVSLKPKNEKFVYDSKDVLKSKLIRELISLGWTEKADELIKNAGVKYKLIIKTKGEAKNDLKEFYLEGYEIPESLK